MKRLLQAAALAAFTFAASSGSALSATAPDGKGAAATLAVVKDVCVPLLAGAKIDVIAKSIGLRPGRDGWVFPIGGKQHIEIDPPGGANPHICSATVIHDPIAGDSIVGALTTWTNSQMPALQPLKTQEKATGALYQLTTWSWIGKAAGGDLAVVYSEDKSLDGKPVAGNLDQASLTVGLTPSAS